MAYWQNGKLYLHGSTQSVVRTVDPLANWVGIDASNIVLISEYCGGGFGSKGAGAVSMAIPALLVEEGRRAGDDAHQPRGRALHRPRAHRHGRPRAVGFRKDGRITALDLFIVEDNGPYGPMGDHRSAGNAASLIWQPLAMRWRGVAGHHQHAAAHRSSDRRARCRPTAIMEPVVTKAAKKLGLDQVAIRRINSPEGKALYGAPRPNGQRAAHHQRVREGGARSRRRAASSGTSARRGPASGRDRRSAASASRSDRTAPARSATTG